MQRSDPQQPLELKIASNPNVMLRAELFIPPDAYKLPAALLLHPHPLFGGSMNHIIMRYLSTALVKAGFPLLRFNFRGVDGSTGVYDYGIGETTDARAALTELCTQLELIPQKIVLIGYSFGAFVGLKLAREIPLRGIICVSPPVGVMSEYKETESIIPALNFPSFFISGDQDIVCNLSVLRELCARNSLCSLHIIEGANHFYMKQKQRSRENESDHLNELISHCSVFYQSLLIPNKL